ncbi:MAG: nicotinate-nucleotide--dimethylbenzimidazole phosphoribosyltransferase, partial [Verrucomicrobia bacterium]|nr:nicotinate-nucleotide--dimethylbenzimidazole phosphoribosyltransferase [Verrucomicrobiota bacterium]
DAAGLERKLAAVRQGLSLHASGAEGAEAVRHWLEAVGGFEIAALTGCILKARRLRLPVVVDGFIATAAALVAARMEPGSLENCFFAHQSAEAGHALVLEALQVEPLLHLEMRLGEASGAALALPLLRAAARLLSEMATFESAGVSGAVEPLNCS